MRIFKQVLNPQTLVLTVLLLNVALIQIAKGADECKFDSDCPMRQRCHPEDVGDDEEEIYENKCVNEDSFEEDENTKRRRNEGRKCKSNRDCGTELVCHRRPHKERFCKDRKKLLQYD